MNSQLALEWGIRGAIPALVTCAAVVLLRVRDQRLERALWRSTLAFAWAVPLITIMVATAMAVLAPEPASAVPAAMQALLDDAPAITNGAKQGASATIASIAAGAWMVGSAVLLLRIIIGSAGAWRLLRRSIPAPELVSHDVRVRLSGTLSAPATVGSVVLLPRDVADWDVARRGAVIAHELTHVEHRDFWWQLAASVYVAACWWNPAAWVISARLRYLAERMSDAAALRVMPDRGAYAALLVEVAARVREHRGLWTPQFQVAMARRSMLGQRVEAVLQGGGSVPMAGLARMIAVGTPVLAAAAMAMTPLPAAALTTLVASREGEGSAAPAGATAPTLDNASIARTDSVLIRLYAIPPADPTLQGRIATSTNPDSLRQAANARTTNRVRWFTLNPDGSRGASGETPAVIRHAVTTPFAVTYCSEDPGIEIRVEYVFPAISNGWAVSRCAKIFREAGMTGSRGVKHPGAR